MEKIGDLESQELRQGARKAFLYHLETIYLVTKSDIKTTLSPATVFAVVNAASGTLLTTNSAPSLWEISLRLPKTILWIWLNLYIFNLANQRLPNSIIEDSINKPWRAIPSGRLTATQARHLLLTFIPVAYLSTFYLGGRNESMALMILTWLYNDLGAGDENFLIRHIANALGFCAFASGASQVACGFPAHTLSENAYRWLLLVAAIITFTIQFQDMEDLMGDRMRNRKTLPIILGEPETRLFNAVVILVFSATASAFWQSTLSGYLVPGTLGVIIAGRTLMLQSVPSDRKTFQLWCLWLVIIYALPLTKLQLF
ncbi:UbiA prenyltransferase [Phlyctema vagabunda]|uniref:UbiA prenyltransferase n=1 Tax=Phlyctema vagabunda TaxID=108571 RepID=A0ABR4PVX8_9HELO